MKLEFEDDGAAHPKTDEADWRESYYLDFYDPTSDLGGVAWMGVRPNRGTGEVVFSLFDGATDLVRHIDFECPVAADVGAERVQNGPLRWECIEPWKHWRLTFEDENATVTIDWHQISAVCDWEWDETNSKHYQLGGSVEVKGAVGGRDVSFSGYGERDRAWGNRTYAPFPYCWWMVAQFPDDVTAHAMILQNDDIGEERLYGYLHQDGVTRPVEHYEVSEIEYAPEDGPPDHGVHVLTDSDGRRLKISAMELLNFVPFVVPAAAGGDAIDPDQASDDADRQWWFTGYRFRREGGPDGRGMVHHTANPHRAQIEAGDGSKYSTIYEYGVESS